MKVFISHSSQDDAFVRDLRVALADHRQAVWVDSRELRGGDPLWTEIQKAIAEAESFAFVVTPNAHGSKWVGKELKHALTLREERGASYRVIALVVGDTKLGVFESFFDEEPIFVPISSAAGGIGEAIDPLLVALGRRLPHDPVPEPLPPAAPLEDLILELSQLRIVEHGGKHRAAARAKLTYEPASGSRPLNSQQTWTFTAPLGPIEATELAWYLEDYPAWPSGVAVIRDRAARVEENLVQWGRLLHEQAFPTEPAGNVLSTWHNLPRDVERRFSVHVDATPEHGADEQAQARLQSLATELLGLPWELLHDGSGYLFQGGRPVRVRRRLPFTQPGESAPMALPIRVLLVTARPEDAACGYIDHRISALPLVQSMESLPGLVEIRLLAPATFPALRKELERARVAGTPYHVVHFDGHGVYNPQVGLGGLCFEHRDDGDKIEHRRHETIYTNELGPLLHEHQIPLVFLEACQSGSADMASESVASELLKQGVGSVVAMNHSVLVETARRFVGEFYRSLANGHRVGTAMLAGQRVLHDDSRRGRQLDGDDFRLHDWFVPVLYQESHDPRLFERLSSRQAAEDHQTALQHRLGQLPPEPPTRFVGRSRDLLALERLLGLRKYAVVRGQGGEGKTTLAAELGRWMVRSGQVRRAAFVSVETHSHVAAVLDALGQQLVGNEFSVATFPDQDKAIQEVERVLREQPTLLVIDNMESLLPPPWQVAETSAVLNDDLQQELTEILSLCQRLMHAGNTRVVFTSREVLPAPFDAEGNRRELERLSTEDGVALVERALAGAEANAALVETGAGMGVERGAGQAGRAERAEIEELVGAVNGHARTLANLAPSLRTLGVAQTRRELTRLMAEMERQFPGSREKSVFASVALSLRRLSAENQQRVTALGVFHGGIDLDVLRAMMEWDTAAVGSLGAELVGTGLATVDPYNHLTLNAALCPYLLGRLTTEELSPLTRQWVEAMVEYVRFLDQQRSQQAEVAATLTLLELPNLFGVLEQVRAQGDAARTIDLASRLYGLLRNISKPRLVERLGEIRDEAERSLGEACNHARFDALRTRIEQQLAGGDLQAAFEGARTLLERARRVGEQAYAEAAYDLAMACFLLARVLETGGAADRALPLLEEARERFEGVAQKQPGCGAEGMASACYTEMGDCFLAMGQYDEAESAYTESISRAKKRGDDRAAAVGQGQLGEVYLEQRKFGDALQAHQEARDTFTRLNEPGMVAVGWHLTGRVHQHSGQFEPAEQAYRESLRITVQQKDRPRQAGTLGQLGILFDNCWHRPDEAVVFYRQAADIYVEIQDLANEGRTCNNLAETFRKLQRWDDARREILRAIECKSHFGHASEAWKTWNILAEIETASGNASAAAEARQKGRNAYLAYRRDGGENHNGDGRLALVITQSFQTGETAPAGTLLAQLAADPDFGNMLPFVRTLQAIVAGSRDRSLAENLELDYREYAEVVILLDTLDPVP